MRSPLLLFVFAFFHCVLALSHPPQRRASINTPPNDAFYTPPDGWESKEPGTVLRTRKVNLAFLQIDDYNYEAAYQILYRTTGGYEDEPSTTVTTVIIPYNAKKNKLVNYLVYTDSNGAQCAPSYSMRKGGNFGTDLALSYQQILFTTFLNEGWILTVPDYQGPTRGFGAGRLEGRMALDAIRATLNYEPVGLSKNTKVVSYGYSGGAIASGWAAGLQPNYAPEINAVGFAMGGTPANISGTVQNLNAGLFSGFAVTGITGVYFTYPAIQEWARGKLTTKGRQALEYARTHCMVDVLLRYPFTNALSDDLIRGGSQLLEAPAVANVIDKLNMGQQKSETPTAPVYMFHGQHDEVIPFRDALKTAHAWANHGADVRMDDFTDVTSEHLVSELLNIPNVLFFVRDRFAGKSFPKGFHRRTTSNPIDEPNDSLQGLGSLVQSIEDIIGRKVGPGDSIIKNRIRENARS